MKGNMVGVILMAGLIMAVGTILAPCSAGAADARVYFKQRMFPLYIQNIGFRYADSGQSSEQAVFYLASEKKYLRYPFADIDRLKFILVTGYQYYAPVFSVQLNLNLPSDSRKMTLIPLDAITGLKEGAPWELRLRQNESLMNNAEKVEEIVFVKSWN